MTLPLLELEGSYGPPKSKHGHRAVPITRATCVHLLPDDLVREPFDRGAR